MIECRLLFGSLDLTAGGAGGYTFSVLAEGADFGSPAPVETAIRTLLQDGSIVSTTSHDNRTTSFQVTITAIDGGSLARGERDLAMQVGKRNTLTWFPPGGFVQPTLFDVVTSSLDYQFDDTGELTLERTYKLTCECLPFGKSLSNVVSSVAALDAASVLDACDVTTGWASTTGLTQDITVDAITKKSGTGSVKAGNYASSTLQLVGKTYYATVNQETRTYSSPLSTGTGGYLGVWVRLDSTYVPPGSELTPGMTAVRMTTATTGATTFTPVAVEWAAGGWVRYVWPVDAGLSVTELRYDLTQYWTALPARAYVRYDEVGLSTVGSAKKVVGSVDVQGSARTPGSLILSSGVALGEALIVTFPEDSQPIGFSPDCRRFYTGGAGTADTNAINGTYITTGAFTVDVPLAAFNPGTFQLVLRSDHTSANPTITATAQTVIGGTLVGPVISVTGTPVIAAGATGAYNFLPVGFIDLPAQRVGSPGDTAAVRITIPAVTGMGRLDEVYLIPAEAAVSIVDCGTGAVSDAGASSYLWMDAPSIDQITGGWWRGASSSRANSRSAIPNARALGRHLLTPPRMRMFATAPAAGLSLSIDYTPQWFTHAWGG